MCNSRVKRLLLSLIGITFLFALCSCQKNKTGYDIQNKKYLIATDLKFPPFSFKDADGEAVGIDVDLFSSIAKNQGINYELKDFEFSGAVSALESNKVDGIMASLIVTEKRKEKYDFSLPYFKTSVSMATKIDSDNIKNIEDVKNKNVAVKTGSVCAQFAEQLQKKYNFNVKYFEDSSLIYEEIKSGNSDVCFEDYPSLQYAVNHGSNLKIVAPDCGFDSDCAFAVMKNENEELLKKFNKGLENIKETGEYDAIINKYIKKDG